MPSLYAVESLYQLWLLPPTNYGICMPSSRSLFPHSQNCLLLYISPITSVCATRWYVVTKNKQPLYTSSTYTCTLDTASDNERRRKTAKDEEEKNSKWSDISHRNPIPRPIKRCRRWGANTPRCVLVAVARDGYLENQLRSIYLLKYLSFITLSRLLSKFINTVRERSKTQKKRLLFQLSPFGSDKFSAWQPKNGEINSGISLKNSMRWLSFGERRQNMT